MPTFFDSSICRSRGHCPTCQDTGEPAKGFRLSQIANGFTDLPADGSPPVCPFNMNPPAIDGLDPDERELLAAAENPEGWGDEVAALIHAMGVDRAYKAIRKATGKTAGCGGCNGRRKKWNRFGKWVKARFRRVPAITSPPSPPHL